MVQLGPYRLRHEYGLEQHRQDRHVPDQYEVVERAGICDDDPHASEAEPSQIGALALEVGDAVGLVDRPRLEEGVERGMRGKTQHAAQLGMGQPPGAVLLGGERFQRAALDIRATGPQALGEVVGDGHGQVHRLSLTHRPHSGNYTADKGHYHIYGPLVPAV